MNELLVQRITQIIVDRKLSMTKSEEKIYPQGKSGRLIKAIPFLTTIFLLGGWSFGFYALQLSKPGTISDSLRCIIFFGGLVVAVLLGALIGSFLKRLLWKVLSKQ